MKYEKPEIVSTFPAIETIQASLAKGPVEADQQCHGSGGSSFTVCAYTADE
jgi:hypothetical protein